MRARFARLWSGLGRASLSPFAPAALVVLLLVWPLVGPALLVHGASTLCRYDTPVECKLVKISEWAK